MKNPVVQSCRSCKWLEIPEGSKPRKKGPYQCMWPEPARVLPISITSAGGFRATVFRTSMWLDQTDDCPTWMGKDEAA